MRNYPTHLFTEIYVKASTYVLSSALLVNILMFYHFIASYIPSNLKIIKVQGQK